MNEVRQIIRITLWGLFLNLVLAALKVVVGIVVSSAALIADAVHSLSDVFSDIVVLLGVRLSSRPPDKTHAYGHGRYETMAASVIGVMLIGAGLFFIWDASYSLYRGEVNIPGYPVIIVALISILAKEGIYQVTQ